MHAPNRTASSLTIRRLQPIMGAEVTGVDLRQPLTRALRDEIYRIFVGYKVIYLPNQDLTPEQQIAFGRAFGDLEIHDLFPNPEHPPILKVKVDGKTKRGADNWHSDNSWRETPPSMSILRAYTLPAIGGDTVFSSATAAYQGLSADLQRRIDPLKAVHTAMVGYSRKASAFDPARLAEMAARDHPVVHPVVRIHPDTGERSLFVNEAYTSHIVGLGQEESDELLRQLIDQCKRPEHQVRISWKPNGVAMWDNRSLVHYGVTDYNEPRHLERVTVCGTKPFGPGEAPASHLLPVMA